MKIFYRFCAVFIVAGLLKAVASAQTNIPTTPPATQGISKTLKDSVRAVECAKFLVNSAVGEVDAIIDAKEQVRSHCDIGEVFLLLDDKSNASKQYAKAKLLADKIESKQAKFNAYCAMAESQFKGGDKAGFRIGFSLAKSVADKMELRDKSRAYGDIAMAQFLAGELQSYKESLNNASMASFQCKDVQEKAFAMIDCGRIYARVGDKNQAKELIAKALQFADANKRGFMPGGYNGIYIAIARVYVTLGDLDSAKLSISKTDELDGLVAIAKTQAEMGDFKGAKATTSQIKPELNPKQGWDGYFRVRAKSYTYWHIAELQANADRIDDSLATIDLIDEIHLRDSAYISIMLAEARQNNLIGITTTADKIKSLQTSPEHQVIYKIAVASTTLYTQSGQDNFNNLVNKISSSLESPHSRINVLTTAAKKILEQK